MADRKVNGQFFVLITSSVNSYRDSFAWMVVSTGVEFSAFVKIGDIIPVVASFFACDIGCVAPFGSISVSLVAINLMTGKPLV